MVFSFNTLHWQRSISHESYRFVETGSLNSLVLSILKNIIKS